METLLIMAAMWLVPAAIGFAIFLLILRFSRRESGPSDGGTADTATTEESSTGLAVNTAAALTYVLGVVTGIGLYLLERRSRTVRFHAAQSMLTFGILLGIGFLLGLLPTLGYLLGLGLQPLGIFLGLFLILQTFRGRRVALPVVGAIAYRKAMELDAENN